jgi:hypothetical protein
MVREGSDIAAELLRVDADDQPANAGPGYGESNLYV